MIDSQGQHISDDKEIVTHLNEYFSSVFTKEDLTNIPNIVPVYTDLGEDDLNFDVNDVAEALDNLRVDKAIGPDGLSPRLLKETKDVISYPLFLLFKKSLVRPHLEYCTVMSKIKYSETVYKNDSGMEELKV